jgi:large repetitive protein
MRRLLVVGCLCLVALGLGGGFSAAAFTRSTSVAGNGITSDALRNYFSVTPGSDVQPGTSNAVASGDVDGLSIDLGTVPSVRTFSNVFRITNVSGASRTATLTLSSVPQVASAVFASSGTGSVTLAAGASTTLSVTTSATVAGRGLGTLRLGLSGSSWLYRDYSFRLDEAPEAPGAPTAVQKPAGRIDLSWPASSTTTNFAGYDVYRSSGGGAYTKINGTVLSTLTYSDTSTVDGTAYTYKVKAVSSGTPVLTSVDSPTVNATADATAPGQPSGIVLANGGGAGNAYINAANASSISISVNLSANSLTSDTVQITVSHGASVNASHAGSSGAGTITFTGLNLSSLGDGAVTISVTSTDLAGNVSTAGTATVTKDTVAPGVPTANYTDNNNANADQVSGTAEANASITVTKTVPTPTATYSTTASGAGAYSVLVAAIAGKPNPPTPVTYMITATDAAGNTSGAYTLSVNDTK